MEMFLGPRILPGASRLCRAGKIATATTKCIHAQGELKVFGIESESSAEFDFCGVKFSFYPDGKRFVGFGAESCSPGSGGVYLVVVVAFFPTRQRRSLSGKACGLNNIGVDPVIHILSLFPVLNCSVSGAGHADAIIFVFKTTFSTAFLLWPTAPETREGS